MTLHQAMPTIQADEIDAEDRSMRVIEVAVALVAFVVAGLLALVR